jgi:nitroimidazol reductase NimA-like FMN-containing flavoprotein (pyridoxamine 5'-phosphate oxidase superfamily)
MSDVINTSWRYTALDHADSNEAGEIFSVSDLEKMLQNLFSTQQLAVLATQGSNGPWGSLVAFSATEDLKQLVFATGKSTRKYANLKANSTVALVMDNRSNEVEDFQQAIAVTATGQADEVGDADRKRLLSGYLKKHPNLQTFVSSPSCALFRVQLEKLNVVYRFQNVIELVPAV